MKTAGNRGLGSRCFIYIQTRIDVSSSAAKFFLRCAVRWTIEVIIYHHLPWCQVWFMVPRTHRWTLKESQVPSLTKVWHSKGGASKRQVSSWIKYILVTIHVQKEARKMVCSRKEGQEWGGHCLWKKWPGSLEVEASMMRRSQWWKEPEEKCFGQKEPRLKRCPVKANAMHCWRDSIDQRVCSCALWFLNLELRSVLDVKYWSFLRVFSALGKLYVFKVKENHPFLNTQWGNQGQWQHRNTSDFSLCVSGVFCCSCYYLFLLAFFFLFFLFIFF